MTFASAASHQTPAPRSTTARDEQNLGADGQDGAPWDSVVIGGGPAGLSAALALGRSLRRTLVIDAGAPRNRFASHMHTVLGQEGVDPAELLRRGRAEVERYGGVVVPGRVRSVREAEPADGARTLRVQAEGGEVYRTRSVIAASGMTDRLPEIPGLAERWGVSVLHCPYCHGWEVRGRRLGVLAAGPMALHQAELLRQWSDRLTFFSAAAEPLDSAARQRLRARGVVIEPTPVAALHGDGADLGEVELEDGRRVGVDALFTAGEPVAHEDYLAELELERSETPLGSFIAVDQGGRTSHERVWAAGNVTGPAANVPMSISAGTMAGAMANMALISEEFDLAAAQPHPSGGEDLVFDPEYWQRHWQGLWSQENPAARAAAAPPNPYVTRTAASLTPGTALDVGSGAGTEALSLAAAGWTVTAADTSAAALALAGARAAEAGLAERIEWVEADATMWQPAVRFDLVTCSYVHTRLPQADLLLRIADWVQPGGTLVMVGHAAGPADKDAAGSAGQHAQTDDDGHAGHHVHGSPPASATIAPGALETALDPGEWSVETQQSTRSPATDRDDSAGWHDAVLIARRKR